MQVKELKTIHIDRSSNTLHVLHIFGVWVSSPPPFAYGQQHSAIQVYMDSSQTHTLFATSHPLGVLDWMQLIPAGLCVEGNCRIECLFWRSSQTFIGVIFYALKFQI
jgi:hypothetical protein